MPYYSWILLLMGAWQHGQDLSLKSDEWHGHKSCGDRGSVPWTAVDGGGAHHARYDVQWRYWWFD